MNKVLIEDLKEFKFLSQPQFNPAGSHLAFIKSQADAKETGYDMSLWVWSKETGQVRQMTSLGKVSSFDWLNDDEIVFCANRTEEDKEAAKREITTVYKLRLTGGEAEKFFQIPLQVSSVKMLNENSCLVYSEENPQNKPYHKMKKDSDKEAEAKRREEEKDYAVIEEAPFWHNGGSFVNGNVTRLVHYDIPSEKLTFLNKGNSDVSSFSLNEDKTKALVIMSEAKGKLRSFNSQVYLLDLASLKMTSLKLPSRTYYGTEYIKGKDSDNLMIPVGRYYTADFLSDDLIFLLINETKEYGLNENAKFFLYKIGDKAPKAIIEDQDITIGSTINTDMRYGGGQSLKVQDNWIYYIETNDTDAFLKRMSPSGDLEILMDLPGSVDSFDVAKDGSILAVAAEPNGLQELYDIKDRKADRLSDFNQEYLKSHSIQPVENLRATSSDDTVVNGFVIKPLDYKKGKKYPGVLVIHGGPKTAYGSVMVHEMQVWANKGYFVFFCNPRGSDGKGNAFADIRGKYGSIDYEDLLNFTDAVLEKYPDIDQKRLGVTGGSYGGFMTNWIIGHTDAFKCAASQRSISNWISFFGTSDIGYYFAPDQNAAWPWENQDQLWDLSPLKYADQCKTPTLFIHSDEDYRCWIPEGYQMFTALKVHGVDARMVVFHGENHELSRSGKPKHRRRRLSEISDWFDKYLK